MPRALARLPIWIACLGVGFALIQPCDGWSKQDDLLAPEKNEHRRVRLGPDSPDEALRYIQIAMRDENGDIAPDGLMNARRQVDAMRAPQAAARMQAIANGEPEPGAGIT